MPERNVTPLPQVPIKRSAIQYLRSETIGQDFQIDISLPASYAESDKQYPVIYMLDSSSEFPIVAGNLRMLQFGMEMPEVILVGIGYKDASPLQVYSWRIHDLTPTNDPEDAQRRKGDVFPMLDGIESGGADDFIEFIETQVKPLVNQTWRVDPGDQTLLGHSLGGLFGLYVLFHHTDSFDKYVLASPSLWWDKTVSYQYEETYARTNPDMAKRIFMSVGELEDQEKLVSHMKKMSDRISARQYPGLKIDTHIFEGESHYSVIGTAFNRGLQFVFKDQMPIQPTAS